MSASNDEYLTKDQLRQHLNLASTGKIDDLMCRKMNPYQKWGSRTIRFDLLNVKAALKRFERKAIGQQGGVLGAYAGSQWFSRNSDSGVLPKIIQEERLSDPGDENSW